VQVVDQDDARLALAADPHDLSHHRGEALLAHLGIEVFDRPIGIRHPQQVPQQRQVGLEVAVEEQQPPGDLLSRGARLIGPGDPEVAAQQLEHGQERNGAAVGGAVGLDHRDVPGEAALDELGAEPALAHAGVGDDAHDARVARRRVLERGLEGRHLVVPAHEDREPPGPRAVQARAKRPDALKLVDAHRLAQALDPDGAKILELEVALDVARGVLRERDASRVGQRLDALGQAHHVPLSGVVHAQIVADLPGADLEERILSAR
jgi:hypothetical protein